MGEELTLLQFVDEVVDDLLQLGAVDGEEILEFLDLVLEVFWHLSH